MDTKAGFIGLVTATGEAASAQGALRVADNVTLRKEGALECRPTFTSTALARSYLGAFPFRGSLYYLGTSNVVYSPTEATVAYPIATPAVRADIVSAKEARGNLYVASKQGVYKVTSTSDTALRPTGLLPNQAPIYVKPSMVTTGTPLLLAANQQVAYRVVAKYTDPNGLIIRSRPSGAVIANSAGVAATPMVTLVLRNLGAYFPTPDEVEIYRTRVFPTTSAVDDEMQLVATVKASQFTLTSGILFYYFTDRVLDSARGVTLYTSPSRGGIENAADRPPGAACLERYRGSLFFGNTYGPHRIIVSWKWSATADRTGSATGLGMRSATGSITNGGTSITSVSSTTGLQVGMTVQGTGVGGRVTAIVGSTVTIGTPATATAAGVALTFYDSIFYTEPTTGTDYGLSPSYVATDSPPSYQAGSGQITAYELTPAAPGYDVTMVLETAHRGTGPLLLRATHPEEYSPVLAAGNAATPTSSTQDVIPNGLAWSEPDEPEHVPPKNFARVGDTGRAILGLVATRDRLLIFKEDGLFMLTGDTAKNFAIYPLDTTCVCILPGSIRRLKNTVFALTNLGLVAVDENGGVTVVSRPIQTEVAPIVNQIRTAAKASGLYLMPGLSGTTGAADDANGEYWLLLGTTAPSFGGQVLIYSMPREGFTTYSFGFSTPVALTTDGEGQPLALTSDSLLTPSTTRGFVMARISPHAFSDPALVGKLWSHIVVGLSQLTGISGTGAITATFSSSEAMVTSTIAETIEAPVPSTVQLPLGTLLRHPIPRAMARSFMLFVELGLNVTSGSFVLELMGAESRENVTNKRPTHGTGAT